MSPWDRLLERLRAYPAATHRLGPPCDESDVKAFEAQWGRMPACLREMVERFNGAEFFCCTSPLFTFFRLKNPGVPADWAVHYYVDTFTARWRSAGTGREHEWAIAMTNYGGLVLLAENATISEWDTGEVRWLVRDLPLDLWLDKIFAEGDTTLAELAGET